MNITYINHSGFFIEWENCCWLFDYYKGEIPHPDDAKELFVFVSHSHSDHFNPEIFQLAGQYPKVTYVFANQVRAAYRKLLRAGERSDASIQEAAEAAQPVFLRSGSDTQLTDHTGSAIRIHAMYSTDCGCAFYLEYEGKAVYHAGDLHWWTWPGEPEAYNKKMAADFKKEISYLADKKIDLAFTPLDPRQEGDYALGLAYLLKTASLQHVFPMHFWNDFSVIRKFVKENEVPHGTEIVEILRDGQSWTVEEPEGGDLERQRSRSGRNIETEALEAD